MFAVEKGGGEGVLQQLAPGIGHTLALEPGDAVVNPDHNEAPVWVSLHRKGLDLHGPNEGDLEPSSMWACVMLPPGYRLRAIERVTAMLATMGPILVTLTSGGEDAGS